MATATVSKGHLVIVRENNNGYHVSRGNVAPLGDLAANANNGEVHDAIKKIQPGGEVPFTFKELAGGKRSNALRSNARRTRSKARRTKSKVGGKRSRARRTKSKRSKSTRRR